MRLSETWLRNYQVSILTTGSRAAGSLPPYCKLLNKTIVYSGHGGSVCLSLRKYRGFLTFSYQGALFCDSGPEGRGVGGFFVCWFG